MRAVPSTGAVAFLLLAILPSTLNAQDTTARPITPPDPPRLQLFQEESKPSKQLWIGSVKSTDFWKPPTSGTELPRWTIGRTAVLNVPGGLAFSAGFFGRRGDPMPLYLSQNGGALSTARSSISGPGTYRDQWDLTFGVKSPTLTIGRVKVAAFGDLFVPVNARKANDPAAAVLNSRALRFGIVALF